MELQISTELCDRMKMAAEEARPYEACGVLLGEENRITEFHLARNVHPNAETNFEIEPQALINAHRDARENGLQVIGYFHSHPIGVPAPSDTDQRRSPGDGRIWAIAGGGDLTFWRDCAGGFQPILLSLVGE